MPGRRAWLITRYADGRSALTDPRLAKDVRRWPGRSRESEAVGSVHAHMANSDPPVHTRLRRLTRQAFTPRRVARLRPRAEEIAAGLLGEMAVAPGGVVDLLGAYARPLPVTVLCELRGIPEADHQRMRVAVADYDKPAEVRRVARGAGMSRTSPGDELGSADLPSGRVATGYEPPTAPRRLRGHPAWRAAALPLPRLDRVRGDPIAGHVRRSVISVVIRRSSMTARPREAMSEARRGSQGLSASGPVSEVDSPAASASR